MAENQRLEPGKNKEGIKMQVDSKLIIKFPGYIAVVYLNELQAMLSQNKDLWAEAIRRGKAEGRYQKEQNRTGKGGVDRE